MDHVTADDSLLERVAEGVSLGPLLSGDRASVTYWRVEPGAELPVHEHHNEQIGYVLSGTLTAVADGEETPLEPGDVYRFPGNEPHGAENRSDEPAEGLGVHAPPREEPAWRERGV